MFIGAQEFRQTKVQYLCLALVGDGDVLGLEVAMDDTTVVGFSKSSSNLHAESDDFSFRQRAPSKPISKCFPRHVLHDEKIDAIK